MSYEYHQPPNIQWGGIQSELVLFPMTVAMSPQQTAAVENVLLWILFFNHREWDSE